MSQIYIYHLVNSENPYILCSLFNNEELLKEPIKIFEEGIKALEKLISRGTYTPCYTIASDYTRYFILTEDTDSIFVFEILQGIFSELNQLANTYKIKEGERIEIKETFTSLLEAVLNSVKKGDTSAMYVALRDLRVAMTKFQFKHWHGSERVQDSGMLGEF